MSLCAPGADHRRRRLHALGVVLGDDRPRRARGRAAGDRARQADPVALSGDRIRLQAGELQHGRREVHERDRPGHPRSAAGGGARGADDQRHPRRLLEEAHLVPEAPLPQHLSVVSAEQDRGAVLQAGVAQRQKHLADALVQVADRGVVAVAGAADLLGGQPGLIDLAHGAQPAAVGVGLVERERRHRRVLDVVAAVAIPEALRDLPRIVRVGERDEHEERLLGAVAARSRTACAPPRTRPRRRSRSACWRRRCPASARSPSCGTRAAADPAGGSSPASSRRRRDRCRWSAAPRTRAAGRARRSASCRSPRCGSPRHAARAPPSARRHGTRRRCRTPRRARRSGR